ncbi:sulfurtransferase [Agaribacterium haliotis]|uniref:sulfurtransferase n=1 Tax=Agaribacterium haliotis TaxID=2013869 RepID=UPI000BB59B09|nr:rhodanese-like domain-containing protein [Agaribacterium haliotis]
MIDSKLLISVEQLKQDIDAGLSPKRCIVDLGSRENYLNGHIPGAVFLPFQALLKGEPPVPGKIASDEQLSQVFSALGLSDELEFLVYDDEGGGWAGRFIWTLDAIGHKNYRYIDGGLQAWLKAGFDTESTINQRPEQAVNVSADKSYLIGVDELIEIINQQSHCIWDARSPGEYSGQRVLAAKAGHMPGALNCEWTELMDSSNGLRIRDDAKAYLAERGIDGSKAIVTHCQGHHRSGFTYLVGRVLGFDIAAYHGAWAEWGNHPETPVELN